MSISAGLLPEEVRTFELVDRFGWSLDQVDEASASRCDWLLALARTKDDVLRAQQTKETR